MIQSLQKTITFTDFLDWKPEGKRYELYDGVVFEMRQPLGGHEEITGFLAIELGSECKRLNLPYFIPKQALIKAPERETCYSPDVLIINKPALKNEPFWQKSSTITKGDSVPLVVEVVSTNWRVDYGY